MIVEIYPDFEANEYFYLVLEKNLMLHSVVGQLVLIEKTWSITFFFLDIYIIELKIPLIAFTSISRYSDGSNDNHGNRRSDHACSLLL